MGVLIGTIIGVAVLAVLFVVVTGRRDRGRAIGVLSKETRRRDRGDVNAVFGDLASHGGVPPSGREVERSVHHSAGGVVLAERSRPPHLASPPVDEETYGVTRRTFMNRSVVGLTALGLSGFASSLVAFLWPSASSGFGSKIKAGSVNDIVNQITTKREPFYVPEGRFYLNPYPTSALEAAAKVYAPSVLAGMTAGVVALYQKCPHLGCRVPWCKSSQWFECPCHGSKYNRVGEKKAGPAPRGMDRFGVTISGGQIVVDTKTVVLGPAIGTDTTGQGQEGPHCS